MPFVGYPIGWMVGIGDLIWILAGVVATGILLLCRDAVRVPRGFGIWLLFLAWMLASIIQLDEAGRGIGFTYRALLYLSATAIAVYAYNAYRSVTIRYVCGVMAVFLLVITAGGVLASLFPLWTFRTPMSLALPAALQSNELVGEMVVRRMTQFDPDAWSAVTPRPSAPFIYTNTWGNVYSLVLPLAGLYAWMTRGTARSYFTIALMIVSLLPAAMTLNRGMFGGLGVVVLYLGLQAFRAARFRELLAGAALGLIAVAVWLQSPTADDLSSRVEVGSSTEDRASLYTDTFRGALESPLFGHGSPLPAHEPWLPHLGTQGQLWTVLFSHGFIAAALFLGWFIWALFWALHRVDRTSAVLGSVVAATLVETTFYGMMTGLNISLLISVLVLRSSSVVDTGKSGPEMVAPRAGTRRTGRSQPGSPQAPPSTG